MNGKIVRDDLKLHQSCLLQQNMQPSRSRHSFPPAPPEAWRAVRTIPEKDLAKNITQNDLRFRGVLMGAGIYSPCWPQALHELSTVIIAGVDCVTHYSDEDKLREAALTYAKRYNQLLTTHLQQIKHPLVLATIRTSEETMQKLKKANPMDDALNTLRKSTGSVLHLLAIENEKGEMEIPGMYPADEKRLERRGIPLGYTPLPISMMFLNQTQHARAARLCIQYITPYNRYFLAHWKKS